MVSHAAPPGRAWALSYGSPARIDSDHGRPPTDPRSDEPDLNPSELRAFLDDLYPGAWRWALHCAGWDAELAMDALHDALEAILAGDVQPRDPTQWRSFAFGVIERHVRRGRRRAYLRAFLPWDSGTDQRTDPAASPEVAGDAARVLEAIRGLSARQADVAWLVLGCDLRVEDAAAALGMPLGTARTHYARAKARLRSTFEESSRGE